VSLYSLLTQWFDISYYIYMNKPIQKIKDLRQEHHLTQTELANKVGLVSMSISQYERGTRRPEIQVGIDLVNLFREAGYPVTLDEIYDAFLIAQPAELPKPKKITI